MLSRLIKFFMLSRLIKFIKSTTFGCFFHINRTKCQCLRKIQSGFFHFGLDQKIRKIAIYRGSGSRLKKSWKNFEHKISKNPKLRRSGQNLESRDPKRSLPGTRFIFHRYPEIPQTIKQKFWIPGFFSGNFLFIGEIPIKIHSGYDKG